MEFVGLSVIGSVLLIAVAILWIILPFTVMGTNKRLDVVNNGINALNNNILNIQRDILAVQKDILSCLEKMSKGPDTSGTENLPEIKLGAESKLEDI
ncbi:MAG: hypothetical protein ACLPVO_19965 [Desulfomonilaceae bacterium]